MVLSSSFFVSFHNYFVSESYLNFIRGVLEARNKDFSTTTKKELITTH
jgi:hypothetical protein